MSDAEISENQKLRQQQIILARFGELALRSDDLDKILTEACYLGLTQHRCYQPQSKRDA